MALTTKNMIDRAVYFASTFAPYLSAGLFAFTVVEEPSVPTCAVDKHWRLYVNPDYIRKCHDDGTLIGEMLHECMHPTMRHFARGKAIHATDPYWNQAGDIEIDQWILAIRNQGQSVKLVDDRVPCPVGRENWTAEEHYRAMAQEGKKGGKCHCGGGSGTGGEPKPFEKGAPGEPSKDGKPATFGLSEAEADLVSAKIAQATKDHAAKHGRGSVPAGLLRWAEEYGAPPPIDYDLLVGARVRYVLDTRRGTAPSYARPSRRSAGPFVLPVHRAPTVNVAMVLDTSGSMCDKDISECLAAVYGAIESLGRVTVVPTDAVAYEPVEVRTVEELREHMRGGGGTSMTSGIARAAEFAPDAIVVVTDGDTDWPDSAPDDVPVIIVLTRATRYPTPAWAEVVKMSL